MSVDLLVRASFKPKEISFFFRSSDGVVTEKRKGKKEIPATNINRFPYGSYTAMYIYSIIFRFRAVLSIFIMQFVLNVPRHPFIETIYIDPAPVTETTDPKLVSYIKMGSVPHCCQNANRSSSIKYLYIT